MTDKSISYAYTDTEVHRVWLSHFDAAFKLLANVEQADARAKEAVELIFSRSDGLTGRVVRISPPEPKSAAVPTKEVTAPTAVLRVLREAVYDGPLVDMEGKTMFIRAAKKDWRLIFDYIAYLEELAGVVPNQDEEVER